MQLEDSTRFAAVLEQVGVDLIAMSSGMCGGRPNALQGTPGYFVSHAQALKRIVGVPIIGMRGTRDLIYADQLVRNASVDLIAVGRPLLAGPNWLVNTRDEFKR